MNKLTCIVLVGTLVPAMVTLSGQ